MPEKGEFWLFARLSYFPEKKGDDPGEITVVTERYVPKKGSVAFLGLIQVVNTLFV